MSTHPQMVLRAARALADRSAAACNVDADDNWKIYGDEFIADALVALDAAGSSDLLEVLQEVFSLDEALIRDIYGSEFVRNANAAITKAIIGDQA